MGTAKCLQGNRAGRRDDTQKGVKDSEMGYWRYKNRKLSRNKKSWGVLTNLDNTPLNCPSPELLEKLGDSPGLQPNFPTAHFIGRLGGPG